MPSSEANLIPITRRSHLHTRDDLEDLPVFDMVQAGIVKNEIRGIKNKYASAMNYLGGFQLGQADVSLEQVAVTLALPSSSVSADAPASSPASASSSSPAVTLATPISTFSSMASVLTTSIATTSPITDHRLVFFFRPYRGPTIDLPACCPHYINSGHHNVVRFDVRCIHTDSRPPRPPPKPCSQVVRKDSASPRLVRLSRTDRLPHRFDGRAV